MVIRLQSSTTQKMGDIRNLFNEVALNKIGKDYYKPIKN